jgi:hypothetical protein
MLSARVQRSLSYEEVKRAPRISRAAPLDEAHLLTDGSPWKSGPLAPIGLDIRAESDA